MQDKKEQILIAAVEVFSKIGFSKTKIQDIATTAGIGKGTVYSYFESKQEILLCACESIIGRCLNEQIAFAELIDLDCRVLVEKSIHYFILEFIPKQTEECFMFYELLVLAANDSKYRNRIEELLKNRSLTMEENFLQIYNLGLERGQFNFITNPRELIISFLSMIDGLIFQYGFRAASIDLEALVKSEVERFSKILFR